MIIFDLILTTLEASFNFARQLWQWQSCGKDWLELKKSNNYWQI
jgi:hypothetical protein